MVFNLSFHHRSHLYKTRNLEAPTQDVKEHSFSVMDFQDIAWYMSAVYFKTPEVTSFFSQHEHFEYSQLSVETFAYATDDDWEIDYHRTELIRHHKTLHSQLFKVAGSKSQISFDDLESTRTKFD